MSEEKEGQPGEAIVNDGVLQLRFTDRDGALTKIPAADIAESLMGLASFSEQMAKDGLFGDGLPPEVKIRPPREGSFMFEAVFEWAAANPEWGTVAYGTGSTLFAWAFHTGIKVMKGNNPTDFEYLENGNVKLNWGNGQVDEVPAQAWKTINEMKHPTRRKLAKILAPLSGDADSLELREGTPDQTSEEILNQEPTQEFTKSDYRLAVAAPEEETETKEFTLEGTFESMDFRHGKPWKFKHKSGKRNATMDDPEFQLELDRGFRIGKEDIFDVTIKETATTVGESKTTNWSMTKIVLKRKADQE